MDELEKIDPFQGLEAHLKEKSNNSEVQQIKIKAQHIEELVNELIQHIERVFSEV